MKLGRKKNPDLPTGIFMGYPADRKPFFLPKDVLRYNLSPMNTHDTFISGGGVGVGVRPNLGGGGQREPTVATHHPSPVVVLTVGVQVARGREGGPTPTVQGRLLGLRDNIASSIVVIGTLVYGGLIVSDLRLFYGLWENRLQGKVLLYWGR